MILIIAVLIQAYKSLFMRKHILGIISVAMAVTLSAFNKPNFSTFTLKLISIPTAAHVEDDETKWSTAGSLYGVCSVGTDLACTIIADAKYTHAVGLQQVLNTPGSTPAGEFRLTITEGLGITSGGSLYRVVAGITSSDPTDPGTGFTWRNGIY